jgi:hypothetical protein
MGQQKLPKRDRDEVRELVARVKDDPDALNRLVQMVDMLSRRRSFSRRRIKPGSTSD